MYQNNTITQVNSIQYKQSTLKYIKSVESPYSMDIIPGTYEGGYKIWQCTLDLLKYISSNQNINFVGKRIIDIGCGHGLLGIAGLKNGASYCVFQDYNQDVLQKITKINTFINDIPQNKCSYIYGDWDTLPPLQQQNKFDIILGSQLTYKEQNYKKIGRICKQYLKQNGIAILANKCYYFGVGGNTDDFKDFLQEHGLVYEILLKIIPNKGGNKKQICGIKLNNNINQQSNDMKQ